MELMILNTDFQYVYVLDSYESVIWVDKFSEPGTFELYTPISSDVIDYIRPGYYVQNSDSEHMIIIEDVSIESDVEKGDHFKAVGRSLESILDRRIVWSQTNIDGSLKNGIKKLLNDAIVSPSNSSRKINNFIYRLEDSDVSSDILAMVMDHQYTGDNLLDVVTGLCDENKIGFKITLNDSNQFVFELYTGTNRSYSQSLNAFVIFSPTYDNLINSNYTEYTSVIKNVALVAGEGEGTSRITRTVGSASGLDRKETYVDARDIRKENLTTAKYNAKLDSKGKNELIEINKDRETFDSNCDTNNMYKYRKDFFLGDIVQISNEYGMGKPSRITEFTWSYSTSGSETYPTFVGIEEEG